VAEVAYPVEKLVAVELGTSCRHARVRGRRCGDTRGAHRVV